MQVTAGRLRSGIRLPGRFNLFLNPAHNAKLTIMENLNSGFILVGFRCRLCSVQLVESLLFVRRVLRF